MTAAKLPSGACEIATRRWGTCAFTYPPRLPVLIGPGDHLVPLVLFFSAAHCLAPTAPSNLSPPHTLIHPRTLSQSPPSSHTLHVIQRRRSSDPRYRWVPFSRRSSALLTSAGGGTGIGAWATEAFVKGGAKGECAPPDSGEGPLLARHGCCHGMGPPNAHAHAHAHHL